MNAGGVAAVVDYIGETKGNVRLPGIMMLGYVAAHSENLAMAVIISKVGKQNLYRVSFSPLDLQCFVTSWYNLFDPSSVSHFSTPYLSGSCTVGDCFVRRT